MSRLSANLAPFGDLESISSNVFAPYADVSRPAIGTKSMQNTSAYEEPRSSGKRLHKYSFDPRSIH